MTNYVTWVIGGLTPSYITGDGLSYPDENRQIKIPCIAFADRAGGGDPQVEIDTFRAIACSSITNEPLVNGGSLIQVAGGEKITITNGVTTWTGALHMPICEEKDYANQAVEYELLIDVEVEPKGGSFVYTPNYDDYTNIEYYEATNKVNYGGEAVGNEIGWMKITEPRNVRMIQVYGSADLIPASLTVNGQTVEWNFSHDNPSFYPGSPEQNGGKMQRLTFILTTPSDELIFESSTHTSPFDTYAINRGCWLEWVRVVYV
jgi:hypothetical protein